MSSATMESVAVRAFFLRALDDCWLAREPTTTIASSSATVSWLSMSGACVSCLAGAVCAAAMPMPPPSMIASAAQLTVAAI